MLRRIARRTGRRGDRPRAPLAALALAAALALLAGACGGGGGVRIDAITATPGAGAADAVTPIPGNPTPAPGSPEPGADGSAPTATAEPERGPPPRPDMPLAGGLDVAGYLAGGEADLPYCLPEVVSGWALAETAGRRCLYADIDADGESEFAFALTLPGGPGDVWFFESADRDFRLFSSARLLAGRVLEDVSIAITADLTGDRAPDLVISARACGEEGGGDGDACAPQFVIASAHRGALENLMPPDAAIPGAAVARIEEPGGDAEEGALPALVVGAPPAETPDGGTPAAPAEPAGPAGPDRSGDLVLEWDGNAFAVQQRLEAPRYLFHAVAAADAAYADSGYAQARALYEAAAADGSLLDWREEQGQPPGRPELSAFALFRAALAAERLGDAAGRDALLARAAGRYGTTLHGQLAAIYQEAALAGWQPLESCAEIGNFLSLPLYESRFRQIWDYGANNPRRRIDDVC